MGLKDALQEHKPVRNSRSCSIGQLLSYLNEEDREALDSALGDKNWQHRQLYDVLNKEYQRTGDEFYNFSRYPLESHRRMDCSCYKSGKK